MELRAQKSDLLEEMQLVQGIVETRATIPILANLLLRTGDDCVEIVATDLQVGFRTRAAARISKPGATTVAAKKIYEILRELPDLEVELRQVDSTTVEILCGDARFRLQSLPPDDYPALPEVEAAGEVRLPLGELQRMIERVVFAVTREDNRFALNGALMVLQPESAAIVATDGHRLAFVRRKMVLEGVESELRPIVPRKALQEIARFSQQVAEGEKEPEVVFSSDENHLHFRVGERTLVCRTLEGAFPNFERVLPEDNTRVVTLGSGSLRDALKRIVIMSYEKSRSIRMQVDPGKLTIRSSTPEVGEAEETLDVDYDGEPMVIGFNGDYLLDWLARVGTEEVEIRFRDEETQGLFLPHGDYDFDYRYIVMPVRL